MKNVRELIIKAFRASTVRGLGETPDDEEVEQALYDLNDALDTLTAKPEFAPSKKFVDINVPECGYVTISDNPQRVLTTVIASTSEIKCTSAGEHCLLASDVGGTIQIYLEGKEYQTVIESIDDMFSFTCGPCYRLAGTYAGSFKKNDEKDRIDIVDVPPVNVDQVLDAEGHKIGEFQEQDFYGRKPSHEKWYFYDKSRAPYAKVWVGNCRSVRIVYDEPCWHDLKLDTDLTNMPRSAYSVLKWRLASDLAADGGYIDMANRCEARYKDALMTFYRSKWNSASPLSDTSAPGFHHKRYNIYEDE